MPEDGSQPVYIIAEAGVNHCGSIDRALEMISVAAEAKADAIKFQMFVPDEVISTKAPKAAYQSRYTDPTESQVDMVRGLYLDFPTHLSLKNACDAADIDYIASPFDRPSLQFLAEDIASPLIKIPSGEITNAPLLWLAGRYNVRLIVSTGMCTIDDIYEGLGYIACGAVFSDQPPTRSLAIQAYHSELGQAWVRQNVTVLQCTTEYPVPPEDLNLRAIQTLQDALNLPIGFSDHSLGIAASIAAVGLGATIIEKHFTLDRNLPGPDHTASLMPSEMTAMIDSIRMVEQAMGDGIKRVQVSEQKNVDIARKSLVASMAVKVGDVFSEKNLTVKRPGGGVSASYYWDALGQVATRDYAYNDLISETFE